MGGLVCAVHRRKNKGFPTLKRTLNLGIEKGRLLKNSRPKGGLIQVICYPASPETVDITGFFEKFCIAIRTTSEWTMLHSKSPASRLGFSHTAPSFLLFPTKLCCANLRRAPPYGLRRKAGIHFITPTQPLKPLGKAIPGRFCFCNNTLYNHFCPDAGQG